MRRRMVMALTAVLALGLTACPGDPVEVEDPEDPDDVDVDVDDEPVDEEPVDDEDEVVEDVPEGVFAAAISGEPDQLDPHLTTAYPSFQVLENVYDTLVQPDDDLEFEEALATSWEVSDDELTWTFTLREDVVWHDGSEFTADDVVYSYERIMDPDVGAANAFRFDTVDEVVAVDEHTVEVSLTEPSPNLLANIGGFKGMSIIPEGAADDLDLEREANGTGPFQLVEWVDGSHVTLEANPDYWGDGPHVEGVEFRFIPEGTVAMTNLRGGQVHWTDNIPGVEVEGVLDDDDLEADSVPSNDYWYFAFNNEREPFDDVNVRRALAFGFDREALTESATFGAATVNQTAIPEGDPFHHDHAPYDHDPGQAEELLAEAGVDDLTVELMVTDEFEETIRAAEVLEAQWAEIGVTTEIRVLDFGTWLDEQGEGNFDAFMLGWLGNIDPHDYYYAQHHCDGGFNFHGYCNEEVDELLDAGRTEMEDDAREELYADAAELIVDEASYVFLYNPDVVHAWAPEVSGYEVRTDRAIRLEGVQLQ